jgi:hypothetical protein
VWFLEAVSGTDVELFDVGSVEMLDDVENTLIFRFTREATYDETTEVMDSLCALREDSDKYSDRKILVLPHDIEYLRARPVPRKDIHKDPQNAKGYLDWNEFISGGYLQEVNRTFFHPLGLALEAEIKDDRCVGIKGIWDYRDDPEGVIFDWDNDEFKQLSDVEQNADRVYSEWTAKQETRRKLLGSMVQKTPSGAERCWDDQGDE